MSDESGDPDSGGELGPFRIGNRLGSGGMGIVYQALDTQLNRQVALKVISPHIGDDAEFRARFTHEAQAQASLDSPHVVQIYSFGEADGRLYIASQLIPDGDLGKMLADHGLPPVRIAVNLMSQVAAGLADAHAAGLIHRDIKPANVLLRHRDHELQAYLADFGIARQLGAESGLTQAGGTVGTPSYMAPELHLGGKAGTASDVYALGCLLWAALAGRAPYAGGTDYQVMMGHVEGPVPQLRESGPLSREINRVLRTAMAKAPEDRYPSAAAMRDDLRAVVRLPDDPSPAAPAAAVAAVSPPSPTPTPTPTPSSDAPAAPPFRSASPSTPHFSTMPTGNYHDSGSSGPRGGKAGWIVAAVIVLVLVAGAITAVVLLAGGSDESGGPDDTPSRTTASEEPTEVVEAVDGSAAGDGSREDQAVAALAGGFSRNGTADPAAAECFAQEYVDSYGVDRLVEAGILGDDLTFAADGGSDREAAELLLDGITAATLACIEQAGGGS